MGKKQGKIQEISFEFPVIDDEYREVLAEEAADLDIRLPKIKMPSGGQTAWTLPNDDVVKTIDGVIVDRYEAKVYWENDFDGSNNPPDCSAVKADGIFRGIGNPGGDCAQCEYGQFGSGKNGGKACKDVYRLFILTEGELLPYQIDVPPTSIRSVKNYLSRVVVSGKNTYGVVTRFGLEKRKNSQGVEYSAITCEMVGAMPRETVKEGRSYGKGLRYITRIADTPVTYDVPAIEKSAPTEALNMPKIEDENVPDNLF